MSTGETPAPHPLWLRALLVMGTSLVVEFAALFVAAGFAGGGHGTYVPATLLFPIPVLTTLFTLNIVAIGIAVVQWPLYAALLLYGARVGHAGRTAALIALAHAGGIMLATALLGDQLA